MTKTEIFLDTNLIIDYIENRNQETIIFLNELFNDSNIKVATSFYNIVEALDKIQEIRHIGKLITEKKYSFDEIIRAKKDKDLTMPERENIIQDIVKFMVETKIEIYTLDPEDLDIVTGLMTEVNIASQDALIVGTYAASNAQIFISNDENLIKSVQGKVENCFHLKKDMDEIKEFLRNL